MKVSTKKLIVSVLNGEIRMLERAIISCRQSGHLDALVKNSKKKEDIQKAIIELEAC